MKYRATRATYNNELYENKDRFGNISGSIRHVQHPNGRKWGANFGITPSIHYSNMRFQSGGTRISSTTGLTEPLPDVKIHRVSLLGNLKFTVHTPIGQFGVAGGFGGSMYRFTEIGNFETIKTTEVRRIDLAYTGFFTERFFFMMGPRYFNYGSSDGDEEYVFAVRLGYFWGSKSGK